MNEVEKFTKIDQTTWNCKDVKQTELCYKTGLCKITVWDIKLSIYQKLNETYICKLHFTNKLISSMSGEEFILVIYLPEERKLIGTDSNGIYNGHFTDKGLIFSHMQFSHIKYPHTTSINGFQATLIKE